MPHSRRLFRLAVPASIASLFLAGFVYAQETVPKNPEMLPPPTESKPVEQNEPAGENSDAVPADGKALPEVTLPEVAVPEVTLPKLTEELTFNNAQTSLIQNTFIASPLPGVINRVAVSDGEQVALDTPLLQLQSDLAEKELVAARAALDAANLESENDVDLRYAKRTLEVRENEIEQSKLANLTYAGAVSKMELQKLRLQVDQAALAMEQADHKMMIATAAAIEKQAAVSIAQTKLDQHTVRTTVAGMVIEIDVEPGEWVEAGKPLMRIVSLDPIRVEVFVDGRTHGRELVGRTAKFQPDGDRDPLHGTVTFVSPELHPVTGQVRLWATLENPDVKIGSGMTGTLVLE